jgi:hypothetical protein
MTKSDGNSEAALVLGRARVLGARCSGTIIEADQHLLLHSILDMVQFQSSFLVGP